MIEMHPEWAPIGAKRFMEAIAAGVYDDTVIYRVVKDQAVQFGFPKDPVLNAKWRGLPPLKDDPQPFHNPNFHRGYVGMFIDIYCIRSAKYCDLFYCDKGCLNIPDGNVPTNTCF